VAQAPPGARRTPSAELLQSRRERREAMRAEWWSHAREVLFTGIELNAKQSRQVEALIEALLQNHSREREIAAELRAAGSEMDPQRRATLREEQSQLMQQRKSRGDLFEAMRSSLTEAQRPVFDMNRARLVAERQAREKAPPEDPVSGPRSPSS